MYNNRNDDYNMDIMADDTDEIQFFDEDEDIGNISDFEEDEEKNQKGNFSFDGNDKRNKEKKPLDKKNLLVIVIAAGMFLILGLLAIPGMIKKSAEKKQTESVQNKSEEQPVYTGETDSITANETGNLDVGGQQTQDATININEPCDTANPDNPANINNPNCANIITSQGQNQNFPPATVQQQQAPAYSSSPSVIQEIPEPYKPEPYQSRNIQKPSSGSLNSFSGGNSSSGGNLSNGRSNIQASNNGNTLQGQQGIQNETGGGRQQIRVRPKIQPKADGVNTFSLQQGSYIPIAITTQMNSDNPSYFMAIVSENVYSKDGRHKILIPMGSKLIGNYMALKNNNDTRMFMVVDKIILPNNRIIAFDNANIIDLKGEIGAKGQLNTKFLQRLGKTLLAVSFSVADFILDYRKAKALARNSDRVTRATWEALVNDPVDSVRDTMDVIDKSWNSVKNRIKIPIGTRLNVLTGNEIVLEEYRKRTY